MVHHWNRVFWTVFIILGAIIIAGSMVHILYLDIIFGLLVVGVGAAKLAEEITDRRLQRKHAAMNESINYLTRHVDSTTGTAERLRDISESRFFKMGHRLNEIDDRMEDKYDDAVKKVISLENRLNEHSKLMLELAKRQEAIKEKQQVVSERLRHMPRVQPKPIIVSAPAPKTQTIFVPRAATVPEKKIMRFELPKIAPRIPARTRPKLKKPKRPKLKRRPKARKRARKRVRPAAGRTIINIAAPKPQVIRKIVKVKVRAKPKPKKAKRKAVKRRTRRGRRIVTTGRTIINIQAPRARVTRKPVRPRKKGRPKKHKPVSKPRRVRVKARSVAKPVKALKRKAPKKVKAKAAKPRKARLKKVELLLRET